MFCCTDNDDALRKLRKETLLKNAVAEATP